MKYNKEATSVLLVGYNGANNTGSEARLLPIIEDVRYVFGQNCLITIPSLNEKNLRRYIIESPTLKIKPITSIFYFSLRKLVKEHDVILLVEGSCYMDTWSSVLLKAFLWATQWAYDFGKPCIAYAVDSGHLSEANARSVKKQASKTGLIILRTQAAFNRLKKIGVKAPMEVTADTAFCFDSKLKNKGLLWDIWPQAKENGVFGMALLDPYCWPVRMRLLGKKEDCYRWPYYFSRSSKSSAIAKEFSNIFSSEADRIIGKYKKNVAIICMESVDQRFAEQTLKNIKNKKAVRIFSSNEFNASEMTSILRSLSFLISMRYHACVLSMKAGVPTIGVAHDLRIIDLFDDIGIGEELCFNYKNLEKSILTTRVDHVIGHRDSYSQFMLKSYRSHLIRANRNRKLLEDFIARTWRQTETIG